MVTLCPIRVPPCAREAVALLHRTADHDRGRLHPGELDVHAPWRRPHLVEWERRERRALDAWCSAADRNADAHAGPDADAAATAPRAAADANAHARRWPDDGGRIVDRLRTDRGAIGLDDPDVLEPAMVGVELDAQAIRENLVAGGDGGAPGLHVRFVGQRSAGTPEQRQHGNGKQQRLHLPKILLRLSTPSLTTRVAALTWAGCAASVAALTGVATTRGPSLTRTSDV